MKCIKCGGRTKVVQTYTGINKTKRIRVCKRAGCRYRFPTFETAAAVK